MLLAALLALGTQGPSPAEEALRPLVVNDVRIPTAEIQRFLIYGPGRAELELRKVDWLIEWGIEQRRSEELEDPEPVSEARLRWEIEDRLNELRAKYPDLDLETEVRRRYRTRDLFERQVAQELRFDSVFLPDDQELWPAVSFEALRGEAGDVLIDDFRENLEYRKGVTEWPTPGGLVNAAPEGKPPFKPDDREYRRVLRQIVRDFVFAAISTRTTTHGLRPELVFTADLDDDGKDELALETGDLWSRIAPHLDTEEVPDARRFLALLEVARQQLPPEVQLPTAEEARQRWRERVYRPFICYAYPLQTAFPSWEAQWMYERMRIAYSDSIAEAIPAEPGDDLGPVLSADFERSNQISGLAKVDVEVLLVTAFDHREFQWKPGGWGEARTRALDLAVTARGGAADWSELLKSQNGFWDPPPERWGQCQNGGLYRGEGRFRGVSYYDLRRRLYESRYSTFLAGGCVADVAFFEAPIGEIVGPYRGPVGEFLLRVNRRAAPARPLDKDNPRHFECLVTNYITNSFAKKTQEALRSSRVEGLSED